MFVDFIMVIIVLGIWQNKQLPDVPLSTIITKEILGRNVAFTSFVGGIATIVARR
jgi:hypothetical protein